MVRLWRFPDREKVAEFAHETSWVRGRALDVSGTRIALGWGPGVIYVHDIADGQYVADLHGHGGRVLMIGFTAYRDVLVSAAADGIIQSWSLTGHKQLAEVRVDASLQAAALDAGNGIVLAASAAGTMAIRIPTGRTTETHVCLARRWSS
jgi:WD40 repeat protein